MGLPADAKSFVAQLRTELTTLAARTDEQLPRHSGQVRFTPTGEIILHRRPALAPSKDLLQLEANIAAHLPVRTVLDALKNAYHYCDWTRHFGPFSGSDPKITEAAKRYILVAFASGCNLGFAQTARHVRGEVSAHELSYPNQRHVTAHLIDQGLRDVIATYNQCALPKLWGTGKTAVADGTKLELARENLISEYHIRYGGYGGIALEMIQFRGEQKLGR